MIVRFDHVVLGVSDLEAAVDGFRRAGFDVFDRGGDPGAAMVNRLIRFPDASFIELVAFRAPSDHRFHKALSRGEGWIDHALSVRGIEALQARLRAAGLAVGDVRKVVQPTAEGREWELRLCLAGLGVSTSALPFLTEDITPVEWRLPPLPAERPQPGGATGIAGVTVLVASLSYLLVDLISFYGTPAASERDEAGRLRRARFAFNERWVEFVEPGPGTAESAFLEARGEGVHAVTLASGRPAGRPVEVPGMNGLLLYA